VTSTRTSIKATTTSFHYHQILKIESMCTVWHGI
jgi:hypothetical protein